MFKGMIMREPRPRRSHFEHELNIESSHEFLPKDVGNVFFATPKTFLLFMYRAFCEF